jgi:hypothetical protein
MSKKMITKILLLLFLFLSGCFQGFGFSDENGTQEPDDSAGTSYFPKSSGRRCEYRQISTAAGSERIFLRTEANQDGSFKIVIEDSLGNAVTTSETINKHYLNDARNVLIDLDTSKKLLPSTWIMNGKLFGDPMGFFNTPPPSVSYHIVGESLFVESRATFSQFPSRSTHALRIDEVYEKGLGLISNSTVDPVYISYGPYHNTYIDTMRTELIGCH